MWVGLAGREAVKRVATCETRPNLARLVRKSREPACLEGSNVTSSVPFRWKMDSRCDIADNCLQLPFPQQMNHFEIADFLWLQPYLIIFSGKRSITEGGLNYHT